ncbi:hypothetical protein GCM10011609_85030 [Lentzea pudingi]|uniref:NADP-dependent 3-hydroxy acid dehydrogenase YdfG n=1 Tax=Lentzea pudingi TaxID=1789439 RepID=A0ABQ2ITA2_9PSEU|nr:SDR family NAD(P)-dependent oxidoreductase [Lentzea pudingi]GGN28678.1 hypothetical protein GCM10011609_85030 [Lentzea pudingi]
MELENRLVLVLGGAGGIGRAGALAFAATGAAVAVADVDKAAAEVVAGQITAAGGAASAHACDVSDDAAVLSLRDELAGDALVPDVLWCHAGANAEGPVERIPTDEWKWVFNTNVLGISRALQAFLPSMRERGAGRVVITSSTLGLFGHKPLALPYIASKAAQIGLAQGLSRYLDGSGVGVTLLLPDLTETGFRTSARLVGADAEEMKRLAGPRMRTQPPMSAEDVADALIEGVRKDQFLVSLMANTDRRLAEHAAAGFDPSALPVGWPET